MTVKAARRTEQEMQDEIEAHIHAHIGGRPVVADRVRARVRRFHDEQGALGLRLARAYVRWACENPLEIGREQMRTCRCEAGMVYDDEAGTARPCERCLGITHEGEPPDEGADQQQYGNLRAV